MTKAIGYFFRNRGETFDDVEWLDYPGFYRRCEDFTLTSLRSLAEILVEEYNDAYAGEMTEDLLSEDQLVVLVDPDGYEICTISVCTEVCLQYTGDIFEVNER
jgi:hypothetical protein